MKVLWFTNTPSLYKQGASEYNGGGWISSLEKSFSEHPNVQLGISFFHSDDCFKVKGDFTTYYPIALYRSFRQKLIHNFFYEKSEAIELGAYLKVIDDFQPDIIHVFGSENSFGLITRHTQVPVVIHIQGLLNPYLNAWFPPGANKIDYFYFNSFLQAVKKLKTLRFFTSNANREARILKSCKYFIGRTNWDRKVAQLYSSHSEYFYCSEILRNAFYEAPKWALPNSGTAEIMTTISAVDYKGYDVILKTAKILRDLVGLSFKWRVYGIREFSFWEKKLDIVAEQVSVELMGVANEQELIDGMLAANVFVHPSYIDNSPNSVCEAQLLGMPVIASYVGGLPSLIEHDVTGLLVPANDPYTLSARICELLQDKELSSLIGANARRTALARHNVQKITEDNLRVYEKILQD